jgi:hypothetical protein
MLCCLRRALVWLDVGKQQGLACTSMHMNGTHPSAAAAPVGMCLLIMVVDLCMMRIFVQHKVAHCSTQL